MPKSLVVLPRAEPFPDSQSNFEYSHCLALAAKANEI